MPCTVRGKVLRITECLSLLMVVLSLVSNVSSIYKYFDTLFFVIVYKFFEQRNVRLRGSPDFAPGWYQILFLIVCLETDCVWNRDWD